MIYKVFYQENKDRNPHREKTKVIYLEVEASNELSIKMKSSSLTLVSNSLKMTSLVLIMLSLIIPILLKM